MTVRTSPATPTPLIRPAADRTRAVVLVLYGGKSESHDPSRAYHLSAVRMVPYARLLHRAGAPHLAVWTARYRYRGWNGTEASPVADAREVLEQIRRAHPETPIVLVGHSMGGRTAMRVADEPGVHAVVGLAPWLPPDEPVGALAGRRMLLVHGDRDKWVDPAGSLGWARRARPVAGDLRRVELHGVGHFMLRRMSVWHRLTTYFVLDSLLPPDRAGTATGRDAGSMRWQSDGAAGPNVGRHVDEPASALGTVRSQARAAVTEPVVDPTRLAM